MTSALAAAVLVLAACTGGFCGADEISAAVVAASAATLFSWMGLDKTRRLRRPGLWSEWINPLLRIAAGSALATGICLVSVHNLGDAIIIIVLSSLALLFLLIVRRRRGRDLPDLPARARVDDEGPPMKRMAPEPDSAVPPDRKGEFIIPAPVRKS